MYTIDRERPEDSAAIEALLDLAFGPDRQEKSAYRLRDGVSNVPELCFVARSPGADGKGTRLLGSVRFWPIDAAGEPALLLGPLAVVPERQGNGLGIALMEHALGVARNLGHDLVILVGDEPYYGRAGFYKVPPGRLRFPGPVDPDRLLMQRLGDEEKCVHVGVVGKGR